MRVYSSKMAFQIEILLLFFIFLKNYTYSLRLIEVRIPKHIVKGTTASLECYYDLDGEALYSVKWYKDGNEFYRYVPRDMPPATIFQLPGVSVDLHNSSDVVVTLKNVNLSTTGRYRCEVSAEAPLFQTVSDHGDMIVVSLPDKGPSITGGKARYQIGDYVRVNCTSGRSKPSVTLNWFVNGEHAEPHMLRHYDSIITGREGLETSILGLEFKVEQHHFRNGDMKLKCVARLSSIYWRSNEESVEGDRPQKAPVLESRETVYASNSRADPVQGSMSFGENFFSKILSFFYEQPAASKSSSQLIGTMMTSTNLLTSATCLCLLLIAQRLLLNINTTTFCHYHHHHQQQHQQQQHHHQHHQQHHNYHDDGKSLFQRQSSTLFESR